MTNAPSRHSRATGSSVGAADHLLQGGGAPARRRYSPERRRRAAARRRRLRGLGRLALLVLIVAISVWVGTRIANATSNTAAFTEHTYSVRSGDSLWSIARRSYPQGGDTRRLVYLIERRNGLTRADVRPGQRLVLPILPD
jgi:nucleoid-associated protein YgaU